MNITRKSLFLASAAVAVIGLGLSSSPAKAFDNVDWTWDKFVEENVLKEVNILIDVAPSGMVELEKIQFMIGDVTASSSVTNFTNNPPGETDPAGGPTPEPGPQLITIDLNAFYHDEYGHGDWGDHLGNGHMLNEIKDDGIGHDWNGNGYGHYGSYFEFAKGGPVDELELKEGTTEGVELAGPFEGHVDEKDDTVWLSFDILVPPAETNGEAGPTPELIPIGERLAIDLPAVNSQATAVGNNQDIESSTSLELHDGQYLIGGISSSSFAEDLFGPEGNSHTNALEGLIQAAGFGEISPASVSADSSVSAILNATVNSEATAVANNMSIELHAFTPDDATMIGDVTQFAYANVSATSFVDDVTIEGYSDMGAAGLGPCGGCIEGEPQIPVINSVATAVGNNFSLKVSSPEL